MPKSKKTKKALKAAKKRKQARAEHRRLTHPVNVPAPLNAPETRWAVPLLAVHRTTQHRHAEGTAFFIAPNILLTAWHNIPALIAKIAGNPDVERDSFEWEEHNVLDFMSITALQLVGSHHAINWHVRHIHRSRFSNDIALLHVDAMENLPADTPLEVAPLDASPPRIGERVRAFGYTHSTAHDGLDEDNRLVLGHDPRYASGNVEQIFEPVRDRLMLPFPCFSVGADFRSGMSGGPVSGMNGRVCGVVTKGAGSPDGARPISYAASIWPILADEIQWDGFSGGAPFKVLQLATEVPRGRTEPYIRVENLQQVRIGIDLETLRPVEVRRLVSSETQPD